MKPLLSLSIPAIALILSATAQEPAALYRSKCFSCHGPKGAGKPALKGSNLLSPEAKKASDDILADAILNGGAARKAAHAYGKKGVNAEQAKSLVGFIRELQK